MQRRHFLQTAGLTAMTLTATPTRAADRPRIKVGQIGTKHAHAAGKMATMRKLTADYEVVAVAEPDAVRAKRVAASKSYRDLPFVSVEQLLNTKGLQAVAIETDVEHLLDHAELAIKAGMHIHLDKPAGNDLAHFKRILDEATRRKLTIQMGYMFRYNPAFQLIYQAVREGWLSNVFEVHAVISKLSNDATRKHLARFPGGTMFELGCHVVDSVVHILGKPDKVTPFVRRTFPEKDTLADNQLAVLEYAKTTATVRSALIEHDGARRRQFVVAGDAGVIDVKPLEPPNVAMSLAKPRGKHPRGYHNVPMPKMTGRYDGEFLDLAKVIRGEKAFDWSPAHDLAVQETVLRASGVEVA